MIDLWNRERPAESAAEKIIAIFRARLADHVAEIIIGVKVLVAEVAVRRPMVAVVPGPGDQGDNGAGGPAVFGRIGGREHLEFPNGIGGRQSLRTSRGTGDHRNTVDQEFAVEGSA